MKKKLKQNILFIISFLLVSCVSGQYFSFSQVGNGYQQGCEEQIKINYDLESLSRSLAGQLPMQVFITPNSNIQYLDQIVGNNNGVANGSTFVLGNNLAYQTAGFPSYENGRLTVYTQNKGPISGSGLFGIIKFRPIRQDNQYNTQFSFFDVGTEGGTHILDNSFTSSITSETLTIKQEPCEADGTAPEIIIKNGDGVTFDTNTDYKINNGLKIVLTDSVGNSNVPFVWTGTKGTKGSWVKNDWNINNQRGVELSNVKITVSGMSGQQGSLVLNRGEYGEIGVNLRTWENNDRDYNITTGLVGYEFGIEKPVTIKVSGVKDRADNPKSDRSITINSPKAPTILSSSRYPTAADYVPRMTGVSFTINDAWAGVNSGTIMVTLSGVDNDYGPYTFTSSQLQINCTTMQEGVCGEVGQAGGYTVVLPGISHELFPASGVVKVIVSAADLLSEGMSTDWTFGAAPSCVDMGYSDPVEIWYGDEREISPYMDSELTLSGSNVTTQNLEEIILSGVQYTGWIFEINCHQSDSALSLYRGIESNNEDIVSGLLLDELVLSGANPETIKAELDGNQLTLSYWVDGAEITQISPEYGTAIYSNSIVVSRNFEEMNNYDWISGFVLTIYTGNNPENIVRTGFKEWASVQEQYQYAFEEVPVSTDYYRSIYIIDKAGRTGESISTGYFECLGVPSGTVEFSNLKPNTGAPKSDFDFEWTASLGENTSISGYRVQLYTGDSCDNEEAGTEIWSGNVTTGNGGDISIAYTGDPLTSLQQYCWKVSAMQGNRVLTGATATFTGMMEVELIADLGRGNTRNSTTGKWLLYYMDDLNNSLYSGYITSITSNEREGNITGYNLVLYSGIKNGNECQGEKLISGLFNGMGFVENVYAGNYCWEIYPVYLDNTTGAIQSQEFSILSYMFIRSEQLDSGFALAYHTKYNPIYSGYVHLGSGTNESPYGTGKIIGLFDSGYYYFVYKDWQHLTVYTGVQLYGSADKIVIDLRYAPGTYSSGQLMVGDTPSRNGDGDWTHDFNINAMDISFVGGSECLSREDKTTWLAICDVNGDGDLQVGDITAYSTFLPYYDVVYSNGLFGGFGLVDYGLSELSE